MTNPKSSEKSEFWKDAEAASKVVAEYPSWKRGELVPPEQRSDLVRTAAVEAEQPIKI